MCYGFNGVEGVWGFRVRVFWGLGCLRFLGFAVSRVRGV